MKSPKFPRKITLAAGIFLLVSSVALTSCAKSQKSVEYPAIEPVPDATVPSASSPTTSPTSPLASPSANSPAGTPTSAPDGSVPAEGSAAVEGTAGNAALPAAVESAVLEDIVSRDGVALDGLSVTGATPEDWPDGCLGLGGAEDICTFAIVPGWAVTVSQGDRNWYYRTDAEGLTIKSVTGALNPAAGE
jgi:hypothetical protein